MRRSAAIFLIGIVSVSCSVLASAAEPATNLPVDVPSGFQVRRAAPQPLVERPMFAALDAVGGLYVLDSGGVNGADRGAKPPDVVRYLTDTDSDGVYDKSVVFADKIVFGTGLVHFDNAVFVSSPPSLWKLEDTTGDGVADKRTELVTGFAFNQSCTDDLHGACLGPDGRIYFLPGRFHHKAQTPSGSVIREGVGPWLMRCRPDGRDVEIVSGAVGNPVEVTFLPTGDSFLQGTFWAKPSAEGGLRDALIHAVPGGEYSVRDRDYSDRVRTGDFLPALVPFTATAPSGLTTYLSDQWGEEFRHNLFSSHFNTAKILRHRLTPTGGTFLCETEDFVTAAQDDVHFTDVLEDADGSLLVIDTGGWYHACCPASGSSKPEVKGTIYRVSRKGTPAVADPYGNAIGWEQASPATLVRHLDDPRHRVRERTIQTLSERGDKAIAELTKLLKSRATTRRQRQNAVWALCRMDSPAAREAGRIALNDPDSEVRQVAAHTVALHRDAAAIQQLTLMLRDDSLPVRREAANALGRIGRGEAVLKLLEAIGALSQGNAASSDRFVEHAYIFAIISINDAAATRPGLSASGSAERRAALMALDQMPLTILGATDIAPFLATSDPVLLQTAIDVLARHPEWTTESIKLIDGWLRERELDETRLNTLMGVVRALGGDSSMRQVLDQHLSEQDSLSSSARRALLMAVGNSGVQNVPNKWKDGVAEALRASDPDVRLAAIHAAERLSLQELADDIHRAAADSDSSATLRLTALRSLTNLQQELSDREFEYLLSRLSPEVPIKERLTALDVVAQARHSDARLRKFLPLIPSASPIEIPAFLSAFSRGTDTATGRELVDALLSSSASPAPELVEQSIRNYGGTVATIARPLLDRLKKASQNQDARLNDLEAILETRQGNSDRGREIFFAKAQCHLCHTVAGRGGKVGPDLSSIGEIRSRRDLLEAVAFPSASFARGFEPMIVALTDGRVLTGLAGRETADELVLMIVQDNRPVEVPLRRDTIEQVQIGRVSTMPSGLDHQLHPQEFSDLIAYLQQLRRPK